MENISLGSKANFFEHKVSSYQKANVLNAWLDKCHQTDTGEESDTADAYVFRTDVDF